MQQINLVYDGPMPDVFIDGQPGIERLQAAFAEVFDARQPSVFNGEDTSVSFVDFLDRHTVAEVWPLKSREFATKLNIYLFERQDVAGKLARLAGALRMSVAVDIGKDIKDDRAFLFTPEGEVLAGELVMMSAADGTEEIHFSEARLS
ncbi:hypothetical protein ACRQ1B_21745 [Rhizobium panacihumi]|uniref:hypothetical protein n=1 Tax=Rhizobium panacihumi TaxID=2008450 RepID=UPI003D7A2588